MLGTTVQMFGLTGNHFCWYAYYLFQNSIGLLLEKMYDMLFYFFSLVVKDKNGFPTFVSGVPPDAFSETGQLWNR
jgi:hypothetical protein